MCLQILALTERQLKPARAGSTGPQGTLRSSSAQRALLDTKVCRQLLDHAHIKKGY